MASYTIPPIIVSDCLPPPRPEKGKQYRNYAIISAVLLYSDKPLPPRPCRPSGGTRPGAG